ncbi:hypothetical protein EXIGLDRAFT_634482, partial [Exidia glandulosa HHB12029]
MSEADKIAEALEKGLDRVVDKLSANTPKRDHKNHAKTPDKFDGQVAHYEAFRRALELYVKAIANDADKINAGLSFLTKGDADVFAENWVRAHPNDIPVAWEVFLAELDRAFLDPRVAENARAALWNSSQGSSTAEHYLLRFDELRIKGGLTEVANEKILLDHLKSHMQHTLVSQV